MHHAHPEVLDGDRHRQVLPGGEHQGILIVRSETDHHEVHLTDRGMKMRIPTGLIFLKENI